VQWGSGRFEGEGLSRDVAAVGRHTISGEEFQKNLVRSLEMYDRQFKNSLNRQTINQFGIAEQVLQGMISSQIIRSEAEKLRLTVSDAELQNAIRSYPAFQRDGKFIGSEEYERLLAYNHMTAPDFEDGLKNELLGDKLKALVTAGETPDVDALRDSYRRENESAELEYILFRADDVKEQLVVGDAELRDFHGKNPSLFLSPEKRAGEVLALKFADFKKEIAVKEEELFAYFKENKAMFRVAGKTKVSRIWAAYEDRNRDEVLQRLEEAAAALTPANFAAKAREISGDEKAKEGGDWGYWSWQSFTPQEKTMIDKLVAGGISSPVDAGQGFSILHVSEKVEEQQENYEAVKARIRDMVENEKLKKMVGEKIGRVYEKIKKTGNLKEGAAKLAAKVMDSGLLTQGQPIQNIDEMGYVSQKLFAMSENEISAPLELPDGVAVVRLTRVVKPEIEKFAEARERVRSEVLTARRLELQRARAQKVAAELNRLADAKKIEEYLKKEGFKVEAATYQRGNRLAGLPETPGLDEAIFALSEGAYSDPLALKTAAAVVKLKSKKIVSDADFAKERESYYRRRLQETRNDRFASYLAGKKGDYKIRFNAEIFEKIKEYATSRYR
jgi:peptidyl-prolyl cis-trans isomerase D